MLNPFLSERRGSRAQEFVGLQAQTQEQKKAGETPTLKTVQSGAIQKRAIAALQEAMERIETLEAEVAALKG